MREQYERQAFEIDTSTPEELGAFMRNQHDAWGRAVREAGIKADWQLQRSTPCHSMLNRSGDTPLAEYG